MTWNEVRKFAEENALELYTPMCGYHKQLQIIDRTDDLIIAILFLGAINYCYLLQAIAGYKRTPRHWWTSNKAKSAMQSLLTITQQMQLSAKSDRDIALESAKALKLIF